MAETEEVYRKEFAETEPDLSLSCQKCPLPEKVVPLKEQYQMIPTVFACPNGVQRMSQSMPGLVETSNNLALVRVKEGKFEALNLTRSSVDSAKEATAWKIAAVFHLHGLNLCTEHVALGSQRFVGATQQWRARFDVLPRFHQQFSNKAVCVAAHDGLIR